MSLKRNISKFNLLLISISSIVGSGWLFGSYYTAQIAGPAAILSWFLGGLFIAIIGLTLAEISTMLPIAGGSTNYAALSHGKFCGILFSWVTWIWSMAVAPIEVQAVLQYSAHFFPNIVNPLTDDLTLRGFLIATILMAILCFVNIVGVKLMAESNKIITIWKLAIPAAIALILIFYHPHFENMTSHGFAPFGLEGILSSIPMGGVAFSFFGFQTGIFLAGEAKNPQKSIPFSLFGSLFLCAILFGLLQLGFIVGIQPSSLSLGWNKVFFDGASGPFAGLLLGLGLLLMAKLLYIDAIVSPIGTALGYVAASSRILYSIGIQENSTNAVVKLNKHSIPWVCILINFILGMLFFLPFSGWKAMASFISAAIVISLVCGPISLPIFREKIPDKSRPFKLPFANIISFVAFYLCTLILYWSGFQTLFKFDICFAIILFIFAVSFIFRPKMRQQNYHFKSSIWFLCYLVGCSLFSYLGEYGGGIHIIGTKSSLIVFLLLCLFITKLANKTSISSFEMQALYHKFLKTTKHTSAEENILKSG